SKKKEVNVPLQKSIPDPTSVNQIANAYIRMDRIVMDILARYHLVTLGAYRDKAAADANKQPVFSFEYTVGGGRPPDPNVPGDVGMVSFAEFKQANAAALKAIRNAFYAVAKTQPELTGAVDVA